MPANAFHTADWVAMAAKRWAVTPQRQEWETPMVVESSPSGDLSPQNNYWKRSQKLTLWFRQVSHRLRGGPTVQRPTVFPHCEMTRLAQSRQSLRRYSLSAFRPKRTTIDFGLGTVCRLLTQSGHRMRIFGGFKGRRFTPMMRARAAMPRHQMIAWRTWADTHSLTITVPMINSKISDTCVQ